MTADMKLLPPCPDEFETDFMRELFAALGADITLIQDSWTWINYAETYGDLRSQLEKYVERQTTGDPAYLAFELHLRWGSTASWAQGIIENAPCGEPYHAAYCMYKYCNVPYNWLLNMRRKFFNEAPLP